MSLPKHVLMKIISLIIQRPVLNPKKIKTKKDKKKKFLFFFLQFFEMPENIKKRVFDVWLTKKYLKKNHICHVQHFFDKFLVMSLYGITNITTPYYWDFIRFRLGGLLKVVELSGGGSVMNWTTLSSFTLFPKTW